MGTSAYGPGTNCVRWLFVICNCIFLVLGAVTISLGIWGLVVGSEGDYDVITGNNTISAAAVLLAAGIITFLIAAIGIIGAWGMWRPLLIIYTIAVAVVIALEVVAAILAFVYRDEITNELGDNMEEAIEDYRVDKDDSKRMSDTNNAVENVQDVFQCCGVESSSDWEKLNPDAVKGNNGQPPAHCTCDLSNDRCEAVAGESYNVWKDGCLELLKDNLQTVALVIGIVAIVFAVIEALLMVMAISLCCCIRASHRR